MLFRRKDNFEKKKELEVSDEQELSDTRKRKLQLLKKIERKRKIKNAVVYLIIGFGLFGGYRFLFSTDEIQVVDQISDSNFVENYVSAYFSYPRTEQQDELVKTFTMHSNSKVTYAQDLENASILDISIYEVETLSTSTGDEFYRYYGHAKMKSKNEDSDEQVTDISFSVDMAKRNNSYLVIRPVEMQYKLIAAIEDDSLIEKYKLEQKSTSDSVKDEEYQEVEQAVVLFLKTYNSDYNQAKLLIEDSQVLDELDMNSLLSLESITSMTKDDDNYCINAKIKNEYSGFGSLESEYYLVLSTHNYKVKKMEVY